MKQSTPVQETRPASRWPFLLMLLSTGAGLLLRLHRLGSQPLWNDEVITRHVSEAAWGEIMVYFLHDSSPPLYYMFLKAWLLVADTEASIRLLPVAFGVLCIPVAYAALKKLTGRRAAAVASLLLAVHPYHIYYSQENRYVTLVTLLGLSTLFFYTRMVEGRKWRDVACFSLLAAASVYTHYYAAFLLAALWLHFVIVRLRNRDDLLRFLTSIAGVFLLFLPWLGVFLLQLEQGQPARETFGPLLQLVLTGIFFNFGGSEWWLPQIPFTFIDPDGQGYFVFSFVLLVPAFMLLVLGVRWDIRRERLPGMMTAIFLVPIILVMLATLKLPIYRPKYLVLVLPYYLALVSYGWVLLLGSKSHVRRICAVAASIVVLALIAGSTIRVYKNERYFREWWWNTTNWLENHEEEGDGLLLYNPYSASAFRYYYLGDLEAESIVSPFTRPVLPGDETIRKRLLRVAKRYDRLWVLDYQAVVHDPDGYVLKNCNDLFVPIPYLKDDRDSRFALHAFATSPRAAEHAYTSRVLFGEELYMPGQLVSGWFEPGGNKCWMEDKGTVLLSRIRGEEIVQVAFYIYMPYFDREQVTATLWVEEEPVMYKQVKESDNIVMTTAIPEKFLDRDILRVSLSFDSHFIPVDTEGEKSIRPKTVLVYGMVLRHLGYTIR